MVSKLLKWVQELCILAFTEVGKENIYMLMFQ